MSAEQSFVITGASTGIGRACAVHMHGLGWRVFAGVRREADAASLADETSDRLTPLYLDQSDSQSIREARDLVERSVGESGLSGLVNNAAVPYGGPVEFIDLGEVRRAFDVNFFGLMEITQAFLPLLRRGRGRIVNMSSMSGWVSPPFLSPYSASKFALEALSDALRVELRPWDIHVIVVEPGAIVTPMWNKGADIVSSLLAGAPKEALQLYSDPVLVARKWLKPHGISADHVARAVARALTSSHPKTRYAVGLDAIAASVFRFLPDRWRDAFFLSRLREGR